MSSLEEEILKEKVSAEESYGKHFSDNGQIYDWNKEKKEYLEIWKIYLAIKLLTPPKLTYIKKGLSLPRSCPSEIALTHLLSPPPPRPPPIIGNGMGVGEDRFTLA